MLEFCFKSRVRYFAYESDTNCVKIEFSLNNARKRGEKVLSRKKSGFNFGWTARRLKRRDHSLFALQIHRHSRLVLSDSGIYFYSLFWTSPFHLLPICWSPFAVTTICDYKLEASQNDYKELFRQKNMSSYSECSCNFNRISYFLTDPMSTH